MTVRRRRNRHAVSFALLSVSGMPYKQIARAYSVPRDTVKRELFRIYNGLGIDGRARLLKHLVRAGYLESLYILMRLIQNGETEAAVMLAETIVTER